MDKSTLILAGIALLAVILVVSIVKKAIKLILVIIGIIVAFSLVNIFVYGVSPIDEFNAYKTNIKYGRDIASYTVKITKSVDNIKDAVESGKFDKDGISALKSENEKLLQYKKEVSSLEHTKKLNFFHDKYAGYLNTIVATSESAIKMASSGDKASESVDSILNKLSASIEDLKDLKR